MYLLTTTSSVQAVSGASDFQTLIKHTVSALEVDSTLVIPINLLANTVTEVELPSIERVQVIAVRSVGGTAPIEMSLAQVSNADVFTGMPAQFQLFIRPEGVVIQQLKLRSSVAGKVEVVVGGKFS